MAEVQVHEVTRSTAQEFFEVEWRKVNQELFGKPFLWILLGEFNLGALGSEGQLLGAARYTIAEGVGYLRELVVKAGQRSRGIGQKLLDAFETDCRERGCHKLCLDVAAANVRAQAFYARNSWQRECLMPRHWRQVDFEIWVKWL